MADRIEKMKTHVQENRNIYIAALVGIAVGASVTALVVTRQHPEANIDVGVKGIFIKSPVTVQTILERRGHPGNVVRCLDNGEVFASQGRAASVMGVDPGELSRHLNGARNTAGGFTFEKLGEAS